MLALLGVRMGDVHLHLCFDGQEPPASVHLEHSAGHEEHHSSDAPHRDQDVDLAGATLFKKAALDHLDLPIAITLIATVMPPATEPAPFQHAASPLIGAPHFLRPPLRGPPA